MIRHSYLNCVFILLIAAVSIHAGWDRAGRRHVTDSSYLFNEVIKNQDIKDNIDYCKEYRKSIEYRNIGLALIGLGFISTSFYFVNLQSSNEFIGSFLLIGGIISISGGTIIVNDNLEKIENNKLKCLESNNKVSIKISFLF
jgi:hypothetical protein